MKLLTTITAVFACCTFFANAQKAPASPPETATGTLGEATASINYSSPSVKGRKIWGELVPLDKVWRAGANEATTIEISADITLEGKTLPKGKYAFFVIPNAAESTIIFNKVAEQWGAYKYDEKQDALRIKVKPVAGSEILEKLIYEISNNQITLQWEKWKFIMNAK